MTKYTLIRHAESAEWETSVDERGNHFYHLKFTGERIENKVTFEAPNDKRAKYKVNYVKKIEGFATTRWFLKNEETGVTFTRIRNKDNNVTNWD